MSQIRVEYRPILGRRTRRKPDAVIRVGGGAAAEGATYRPSLWLTVAEAERIAAELVRVVKQVRQQTPTQEDSPDANVRRD